jgi:sugar lactone lactonase YvrE
MLFAACAQVSKAGSSPLLSPGLTATSKAATASPSPTPTPERISALYSTRLLFKGNISPGALTFDPQGRLVFSDVLHGTIDRLNANGSVTILVRGLEEPEGLVYLPGGTLIIAEQETNRILALSPSSPALSVLRTLPGNPSTAFCQQGVDGIALDPATSTLIVPDSPTGNVYSMSLNGERLSLLASHIAHPVGAAVDAQGNIFVPDECGGALWQITPGGHTSRFSGFGMPATAACDTHGNVLVTDLKPSVHALILLNPATGQHTLLASRGFLEPRGLAVNASGDIYLADGATHQIIEYLPR